MTKTSEEKKTKKLFPFIMGGIILTLAVVGIVKIQHARTHAETDDAQIEGNISPVAARVSGYINDIKVVENQVVKVGDTLVCLDNRDLVARLSQAEAGLENAKAALAVAQSATQTTRSTIASSQSGIDAAKVKVWQANQDFKRFSNLIKEGAITQQQFDAVKANKEAADAQLSLAISQRKTSQASTSTSNSQIAVAQAQVKQREAEVEMARLQVSYATLTAATSGTIAKKNIQPGQLVQAGQSLFAIVRDNQLWVTANFKETQLEKMRMGQKANVTVDAYPDKVFTGVVESFSPATGAKFALLPPDNASGNFVKVVQRVPVRIQLDASTDLALLRAGMNVKASIILN
jgi:membrane fusion protein (multidrug efflux system)